MRYFKLFLPLFLICTFIPIRPTIAQDTNPWDQVVPLATFGYGNLNSVAWSPLNGQLVTVSESGFQFYNENLTLEGERRFPNGVPGTILFSPNVAYVALQESAGLIIRDTQTWQPVLGISDYGGYLSWSPDSRLLAMWMDYGLRIWDVETAEVVSEITQLTSYGGVVQWSPDGKAIAIGATGAIVIVRIDTGELVRIHAFDTVIDFDWSMDGKWFAVVGRKDPLPTDLDPDIPVLYDLMKLDALTGEIVMTYPLASGGIYGSIYGAQDLVSMSPNGRYVACRLTRWEPPVNEEDLPTTQIGLGETEEEWQQPEFASFDDSMAFQMAVAVLRALDENDPTTALMVAEEAITIAANEPNQVKVNLLMPKTLQLAYDIQAALQNSDLSQAVQLAQTAYQPYAPPTTPTPETITTTQIAPDSVRSAAWVDVGMGLWDFETGEPLHNFADLERPTRNVYNVSWSPDGAYFATSYYNTLTVFEARSGTVVNSVQAYMSDASPLKLAHNGDRLTASNGLWDSTGQAPAYLRNTPLPLPQLPPPDLSFLRPNEYVYDYNQPPYRWEVIQVYEDRGLVITYEQDIEYPGTPEYDDEEPPEERYIIWNIATEERYEERTNLGEQTAWLYDLANASEREGGNTYFNVLRTTQFVSIGDDEIIDLRTRDMTRLEVNRWEWREVWFSPKGERIYAYDTDRRFKAYDPATGDLLYETIPASRDAFTYSPDNSLFTLVDQGTIYVYDATTGELLMDIYPGRANFWMLWSEDATRLAVGGDNQAILIYDIPSRTRLGILRGHRTGIYEMNWNPDCNYADITTCNYVFVSSDYSGRVILWGIPNGVLNVAAIPNTPAPPTLDLPVAEIDFGALDPLWTYIAEGDSYGRPRAFSVSWKPEGILVNNDWYYDAQLNLLEGKKRPTGQIDWGELESLNPAGWSLNREGVIKDTEGDYFDNAGSMQVNDAAFGMDGFSVFTAESAGSGRNSLNGWLREWHIDIEVIKAEIFGQPDRIVRNLRYVGYWGGGSPTYNQIAVSPDGQWLATATLNYYDSGGRGQIWYAPDHFRNASLIGHTDDIIQLFWHPVSNRIITASKDGTVRMWDKDGVELARWQNATGAPISQMEWGPTLATVVLSAGGNLYELDAYTLTEKRQFAGLGGPDFDWSPDKKQLVVIGQDSIVRVVDFVSGQVLAEERRHMPEVTQLQWHPDGEKLAVARRDGSVILLDGVTGHLLTVLRPYGLAIRSMTWNTSGTRLLLDLEDGPIEIMDGATGEAVTRIENRWRRIGAWWTPDGSKVAFGTYPDPNMGVYTATSLVWVYDVESGEPLYQLPLDWDDYSWYWEIKPFYLAWSGDGQHLAAFYGRNKRLRVWDLSSPDPITLGTHTDIGRDLSLALWDEAGFTFWMTTGRWRYEFSTDHLAYESFDGLPQGTLMRPDGNVLLISGRIIDFATAYPFQEINYGFSQASWHPSCWSRECSAILAVSSGQTITMWGYPQGEE